MWNPHVHGLNLHVHWLNPVKSPFLDGSGGFTMTSATMPGPRRRGPALPQRAAALWRRPGTGERHPGGKVVFFPAFFSRVFPWFWWLDGDFPWFFDGFFPSNTWRKKGFFWGFSPAKHGKTIETARSFSNAPPPSPRCCWTLASLRAPRCARRRRRWRFFWWFWGEGCPVFGVKTLEKWMEPWWPSDLVKNDEDLVKTWRRNDGNYRKTRENWWILSDIKYISYIHCWF